MEFDLLVLFSVAVSVSQCCFVTKSVGTIMGEFCLFVLLDSLRPINNLSVKQGQVFLD